MYQRLAKALLEDIYHPVSAVISIGDGEAILGVHLFDTAFFGESLHVEPEAKEIWLMSNHFDGCRTLYDADVQNLRRLCGLAGGRRLRMFLASEEYACREVELPESLLRVRS